MRINRSIGKIGKSLNFISIIQVFIMIKNIGWSLLEIASSANPGPFWGVVFRALLQGIFTIYIADKMRKKLNGQTTGLVIFSCLSVGFTSIGTANGYTFNYGLLELLLVLGSIVFLFRYLNYKSAVFRQSQIEKEG